MAESEYVVEPNYIGLSNLGSFSSEQITTDLESSVVEQSLSEVAALISLGDTNIAVPSRILGKLGAYEEAGASDYVLDTVREGYKLVFVDNVFPPSDYRENNSSALMQNDFLFEELLRLESLGCLRRVQSRPHIVNPCSVVFSRKLCCVLDASQHLNKFCVRRRTSLADLSRLPDLLREGDFMTVNDLDSGYWQVPIYPPHQTCLGLSFTCDDGSVLYWVWAVMPLGIIDAAHIFTALTHPLMSYLQVHGARSSIYIDDLLSLCQGYEAALLQDKFIQEFFLRGGWVFKPAKSSGPPSQRVKYLGLIVDSVKMQFEIPQDKLSRLLEGGEILLSSRRVHVRNLASWVGLLQSVRLAVGPLVSLMCRSIYDDISNARSWSTVLQLSYKCKHQVDWWVRNLSSLSGYPITKESSVTAFDFALASDASDKGFYSYRVDSLQRAFSRPFSADESEESSTFKELTAIKDTWSRIDVLEEFRGKTVGHMTDSKAAVYILSGGSRNPRLQALSLSVFLTLRKYGITLIPIWKSRDSDIITRADLGSRDFRSDDYSLDPVTFDYLKSKFGPFDVDPRTTPFSFLMVCMLLIRFNI